MLTGLSAAGASLLRLAETRAATGSSPLRFLFVYTSAGRDSDSICSGSGTQFQFGAGLAPLEPIRDKVLVLDGLRLPDHTGEEHPCGRSSMLTCYSASANSRATSVSFDRFLANRIANGDSVYAGLHGFGEGDIDLEISWEAADTPNHNHVIGPQDLLQRLFPGGVTSSDGQPTTVTPNEDELALNTYLTQQVERLVQVAPSADEEQVRLHLQTLEQLRADIQGGGIARSCSALETASGDDDGTRMERLVAHALACGRTSIAVLRVGTEEPKHQYSHWQDAADYRGKLRELDIEEAGRFTRLIQLLDSYPEDGGTLLDNTLVVWSTEVAGGFDEDIHGTRNIPFVLAGGGNRLKLGQRIVTSGKTNAHLYRALGHLFGLSDALDFGDPRLGSGMLEEILG
jgi:hypothetical protein